MSGNVEIVPDEVLWSIWGSHSNIMKSPSPKCYMTFLDMTIYRDTLNWTGITPICEIITELDIITDFDLITKFRRFP